MIQMSGTNEKGERFYLIGLSRANCELLLQGRPVAFPVEQHQEPIQFVIVVGGETEESITEELAKHFTLPKPENAA